jgi:hypothetical protein
MPVLISTKKGFINSVIEPQFQSFGTGTLVTVQFSEYDDVRDMRRHLKGDVLFDQHAQLFPFTSYIHLDDLIQRFKHKKIWKELQNSKVDFSKPPVAYYWEAYYLNESDDENAKIDESLYFGNSLLEDAEDIRWSFEEMPTMVHVYPLYELPKDLIQEHK